MTGSPRQDPGYGQSEAPDIVVKDASGRVAVYYRRKDAPKPEDYDYSTAHRTLKGWRVFFLFLGGWRMLVLVIIILAIGSCLWMIW